MTLTSSRLLAGDLNQRICIQSRSTTPDAGGGSVKSWADVFAGVWATVEPLNGGEAFRQGMLNTTQLYRVTIRWRAGVTAAQRVIWNGLPLNIRTCADPDGRRRALIMTVESGAPEPA